MAIRTALVNGRNYAHKDIVFNVGGVPITSLSNLSITEKSMREFSYGTSELPVGYGEGRKEPVDVTFTISKKDAIAIENASPNGEITSLAPFDIPISWLNPELPRLELIKNVLITQSAGSTDEGNMDAKIEVTAIASHIERK